jgi:hypothetical protein
MYSVDEKDRVRLLNDIPQSSVGAPIPVVLSSEHITVVAFYLENAPANWGGSAIRIVSEDTAGEPLALVRFAPCYATMFGPPNDEAIQGHPLYERGVTPYGAFVIENSSWIRRLERMNSAHVRHKPERFLARNHYVLSFHDTTFECVADGYTVEAHDSSVREILPKMIELLD